MKRKVSAIIAVFLVMMLSCSTVFASEDNDSQSQSPSITETTTAPKFTPNIVVNSFSISSKKIMPKSSFTLDFALRNTSADFTLQNVVVKLSGGDAFSIKNTTDTQTVASLAKGSTVSLSQQFVANSEATAGIHSITVSVSYEYIDGGEKQQGTSESNISITVNPAPTTTTKKATTKKADLTPQLLISSFSYGKGTISGGQTFTLSFNVKNNSTTQAVKNVVIKLSGGETYVVADGTDTLSVSSIAKNSTKTFSKKFMVLQSAASGVYPISASVTYEYYQGSEKQQGTSELTMSVPVVQPDKIQLGSLGLADTTITVNQESDCSFQIINSGQTKLSNGSVSLQDEDGKELVSAFLGNIEAGTQFTSNYNLPITFDDVGKKNLVLVFTYENENMEKQTVTQNLTVNVEEESDPFEDVGTEPAKDTKSTSPVVYIGAGIGGAVLLAVIITIVVKKKKKKKAAKDVIADEEI